jgi:predicted component of type VI protein secretion system
MKFYFGNSTKPKPLNIATEKLKRTIILLAALVERTGTFRFTNKVKRGVSYARSSERNKSITKNITCLFLITNAELIAKSNVIAPAYPFHSA